MAYEKNHYFDGTEQYEKRLSKIEQQMSILLKKVEDEDKSVNLNDYEIYFIQLFLLLQASRQLNTVEVIKYYPDEIYSSNNFLFGVTKYKI